MTDRSPHDDHVTRQDDHVTHQDVGAPTDPGVRSALVFGGSSGIGAAIVRALLDDRFAVVIADVQAPLRDDERNGGVVNFVPCDVTSETDVASAVTATVAAYGRIDAAIDSAGVSFLAPIETMNLSDFNRVHAVNVVGAFLMIKHVVPPMKTQGGGRIALISSIAGLRPTGLGAAAYASSKGAVMALARGVVKELAPYEITINVVAPGPVQTPMSDDVHGWADAVTPTIPAGRVGRAEEIAAVVAFLVSPRASFLNGATIAVDGGASSVIQLPPGTGYTQSKGWLGG